MNKKENAEVVRSVYFEQDEILRGIMKLHSPEGFDCDMTYGNGQARRNMHGFSTAIFWCWSGVGLCGIYDACILGNRIETGILKIHNQK